MQMDLLTRILLALFFLVLMIPARPSSTRNLPFRFLVGRLVVESYHFLAGRFL